MAKTTKRLKRTHPAANTIPGLTLDAGAIKHDYFRHLSFTFGRDLVNSNENQYKYTSLAFAIRDRLMERWKATHMAYHQTDCKTAYYLSMEYLMGRAMTNAALNLGIDNEVSEVMKELGTTYEEVADHESDAGLGNGGLGRLAACFIDSCATLRLPVVGYGLRYEYGMFKQKLVNGEQIEEPDQWLKNGHPWELERPEYAQTIKFGGKTVHENMGKEGWKVRWEHSDTIIAKAYDVPVPGYQNGTVNTLRLWKSIASDEFDLSEFNRGDYANALMSKNSAENISMVLYPNDKSENGKELRLKQQYFLASASLQDILRRWKRNHKTFNKFAEKNCFQLNDTHPTIAVAELMRLLIDEEGLDWENAWDIVTKTMAYTNHTLLPEALEKWSVDLMTKLLPRVMEIIYEINARFLRVVANKWPGDTQKSASLSIIEEGPFPQVRMANLAIVGSFSVNGVAQLHSDLLQQGLFKDFYELSPEKFNNKTNGITQRRWLAGSNPELRQLINDTIGTAWICDLPDLKKLEKKAKNKAFQKKWSDVKLARKEKLADLIKKECGITVPLDAMFDVQVKRIHEYKRQLLNVLHVIHLYDKIKKGDTKNWTKRVVIIGGKAAPGYAMAKSVIKLINNVADVVNNDCEVGDLLKVVFIPNYRVSVAEVIFPGTDLSEQISTAGKEASGTGNMKFMLNGALTIGTLDGANVEMREEVGEENFFLFGRTESELEDIRPTYNPYDVISGDADLARVIELLRNGHFNPYEPGIFNDIISSITDWGDYWMVCEDFRSYIDAQKVAAERFQDKAWWTEASIRNTACSGKFSSDRTIEQYNDEIWKLDKVRALPVG